MLEIKIYREAKTTDMPQLKSFALEHSHRELYDYLHLLQGTMPGEPSSKIWICEIDNKLVGLAIGNEQQNGMPVLFVHPGFSNWDIGTRLTELLFGHTSAYQHKNMLPPA